LAQPAIVAAGLLQIAGTLLGCGQPHDRMENGLFAGASVTHNGQHQFNWKPQRSKAITRQIHYPDSVLLERGLL
jgi:hypothetical protein